MPAPHSTDLIDVVDDAGRIVGASRRGDVLEAGDNFRTVHVLVIDRRDQILLQELAPDRARHPGRWGSSVAGYLHRGETYPDGAARRLREELGLDLRLVDSGVEAMRDEHSTKFVGLFTATYDGSALQIDDAVVAAVRWWDLTELEQATIDRPASFTPTFRTVFTRWRTGAEA